MTNLWHNIRYGFRALSRAPVFTLAVIFSLALGIGATSAIFSAVNAILLRPLPFQEPERLVVLSESSRSVEDDKVPVAPPDFFDWQTQSRQLAVLAAYHPWSFSLSGGGDPEQLGGAVSTPELFKVLGVAPMLGRIYRQEECHFGGPAVIVLSHGLWQRRFGGDPKILGRAVTLDDLSYTVIGVMPPDFKFPTAAELWKPLQSPNANQRAFQFLRVVGRLAPGATVESARREIETIAARLEQTYPDTNSGREALLSSMHEATVGELRPKLKVLLGGVFLMLLTSCFNVANLLLARGLVRQPEMALRQTLGATRGRLLGQLLTENFLLALGGGALGLLVGYWGARFLVSFGPRDVPRLGETAVDSRVLAFTAVVTLLSGLLFGLVPALQGSRLNLRRSIQRSPGKGRLRLLHGLVALQIAVALTLLVGAVLLGRSFQRLTQVSPGFEPSNLLTLNVNLPAAKYDDPRTAAFFLELEDRIGRLPGVTATGTTMSLPIATGMNVDVLFDIEGRPAPASGEENKAFLRPVSPGYLQAMRIPLRKGRLLAPTDRADVEGVVVINETLARTYWPGEEPVGKRLSTQVDLGTLGRLEEGSREVVGVVGDVRHEGLANEAVPEIYVSSTQSYWRSMNLVIRTSSDPASLTRPVLEEVWRIDKNLPVAKVRTMEQIVAESVGQPRFYSLLLALFAGVALLLAAIGVYGLVSYSVSQQTREIGIRMALGASRRKVLGMVLKKGLLLASFGMLAGVGLTLGLGRFLASLLFGVETTDLATFALVCLALGTVTLLSTYLPARRLVKADPMAALRNP